MTVDTAASYTIAAGDSHGITLDDILAFIAQIEKIDPGAVNLPLRCATYAGELKALYRLEVSSGIPSPRGTGDVAAPEQPDPAQVDAAAYAAKVLTTLEKVRALAERWARKDKIDAYTAMRAICIDLGIDLHPDTKAPVDEDDD